MFVYKIYLGFRNEGKEPELLWQGTRAKEFQTQIYRLRVIHGNSEYTVWHNAKF